MGYKQVCCSIGSVVRKKGRGLFSLSWSFPRNYPNGYFPRNYPKGFFHLILLKIERNQECDLTWGIGKAEMILEITFWSIMLCPHLVAIQIVRTPIPGGGSLLTTIHALSGFQDFVEEQLLVGGIGRLIRQLGLLINPELEVDE